MFLFMANLGKRETCCETCMVCKQIKSFRNHYRNMYYCLQGLLAVRYDNQVVEFATCDKLLPETYIIIYESEKQFAFMCSAYFCI